MTSNDDNGKASDKVVLPKTESLDESKEILLTFLTKWANGELDPPSDTASTPAALSSFSELDSLGDSSPAFDLPAPGPDLEVPKPDGDGNRYLMLGQLGEGGMGEVFLAFDQDLRRHLALKSVREGADQRQLWRFLKEAQVLGQLGHPNIVTVYEMGVDEVQHPLLHHAGRPRRDDP